jgi:hypothetical protein
LPNLALYLVQLLKLLCAKDFLDGGAGLHAMQRLGGNGLAQILPGSLNVLFRGTVGDQIGQASFRVGDRLPDLPTFRPGLGENIADLVPLFLGQVQPTKDSAKNIGPAGAGGPPSHRTGEATAGSHMCRTTRAVAPAPTGAATPSCAGGKCLACTNQ